MTYSMNCRRLSVAPMMERTDRHFRYLLRLLAPRAYLYTEMITASAIVRGDAESLLQHDPLEHPVAVQLGGSDPDQLAEAARVAAAAGYDEVNLNVGCPSDRVQAGCFGAALMLERDLVADCVQAMRAAVAVPVTVKTRLGVDDHDSYAFLARFAEAMVAAGCETLIVHARKAWLSGLSPKQNREIPPLDYDRVHRLKRDYPGLEIIINGGLTTAADCLAQLEATDGVMLGRAAYDNPLLIRELDAAVFGPSRYRPLAEVLEAYCGHIEQELEAALAGAQRSGRNTVRRIARHLTGLVHGRHGARRWRHSIATLPDGAAGLDRLDALAADFFADERPISGSGTSVGSWVHGTMA